ncbi:MAG: hypothetical protein LC781_10795 [Actinobacteria bacterium]|nr:hypothetical protein [Actinomycetota bacterium]
MLSEEPRTENPENPERIPRPEEVLEHQEELPPEQKLRPMRCRAGSRTGNPCPREATTWMHPENRDYPMCGEHARAYELALESMGRSVTEDVTGDWLRIARAWGFEDLERLAFNARESAKEEFLKAEARAELAREVADAPCKSRKDRIANLTPEQDAESRRLISRADALVNARTALEDHATGKMDEEALRRTLGVLVEEGERATEEAHRYHEEIGIRPE